MYYKIIRILIFFPLCMPVVTYALTSSEMIDNGEKLYINYDKDYSNLDKAIDYYYNAIEKNKDIAYEAYWRIATIYWTQGQIAKDREEKKECYRKGIEAALKGIDINENRAEAHYWYFACQGELSSLKGKMSAVFSVIKLKRHVNLALKIDPNYTYALNGKAILLKNLPSYLGGNLKKSEELFKKAIRLDPNLSPSYISLAELYSLDGRKSEARILLEKAINLKKPRWKANWRVIFRPRAQQLLDKLNHQLSISNLSP